MRCPDCKQTHVDEGEVFEVEKSRLLTEEKT